MGVNSIVERQYAEEVVPTNTGLNVTVATSVTAGASNYVVAMTGNSTASPNLFISVQAKVSDIHLRFKTSTSTAAVTTSNGILIPKNTAPQRFYLAENSVIDAIATDGNGVLVYWISSKPTNYQAV